MQKEPKNLDEMRKVVNRLEVTMGARRRMRAKRTVCTMSREEGAQNADTASSTTQQCQVATIRAPQDKLVEAVQRLQCYRNCCPSSCKGVAVLPNPTADLSSDRHKLTAGTVVKKGSTTRNATSRQEMISNQHHVSTASHELSKRPTAPPDCQHITAAVHLYSQ